MRAAPAWVRGQAPPAEEAAAEAMRQDVAAGRLHTRGVGHLPLDRNRAQIELGQEQRAGRASRPPSSRRWKQLARLDADVDKATQRQADALSALQEAEQRLQETPAADARSLADWLAAGERGERPASTLYERERDRDAARLLVEAAAIELERVLERRLVHVEGHRPGMLEDAQRDVTAARERLLAKVSELPELRETLLAARGTLLWVAGFPEPTETFGFATAVALGLRAPVEKTLGTRARIEYTSLLAALEADAAALAEAHSAEQKRQLGIADPPTPLREALWDSDPAMVEFKRSELARARQLAEYGDVNALAAEANDYRPDPVDLTPR